MDPEALNLDHGIELLHINQRVGGGIYRDSARRLWLMYLSKADDHDAEITELWKGEADSILVFTGLFSSVIATFLSMSYNELSPNAANTTNALLAQISQQLVNISNSQSAATVTVTLTGINSQQFTPSASAIRVNLTWFLSLVLSIVAALNATLFQQWSRRYLELTRHRIEPHKRARTRAYMFHGIESFKMSRLVKATPVVLHLSIFLFFVGLIDFLWNANTHRILDIRLDSRVYLLVFGADAVTKHILQLSL